MTKSDSDIVRQSPGIATAMPFVIPLFIYLFIGSFEPNLVPEPNIRPSQATADDFTERVGDQVATDAGLVQRYYWLTVAKFIVVGASLLFFLPAYRRMFPSTIDHWACIVGILGVVLWIGICALSLEPRILNALRMGGNLSTARSHFDPFQGIHSWGDRAVFLAARFGLILLIVPLAEELFVRGFLMRIIQSGQWTQIQFKDLGWTALITGSVYGVLTHPNEALAAIVWFSLVSWLMIRTNSFWNCVLAHALTNGLLAGYIVAFGQWQLW